MGLVITSSHNSEVYEVLISLFNFKQKENPYIIMPSFALLQTWFYMPDIYHFRYIFKILSLLSNAITVALTYHATI